MAMGIFCFLVAARLFQEAVWSSIRLNFGFPDSSSPWWRPKEGTKFQNFPNLSVTSWGGQRSCHRTLRYFLQGFLINCSGSFLPGGDSHPRYSPKSITPSILSRGQQLLDWNRSWHHMLFEECALKGVPDNGHSLQAQWRDCCILYWELRLEFLHKCGLGLHEQLARVLASTSIHLILPCS